MPLRKFCWLYFLWTNFRAAEIFVGKNSLCVFIVADNPIEIEESESEVENDSDDDGNDGNDSDDHNDPIEIEESESEVENDSDDNGNDGNDSDDHNDDRITNIVDYLDIVINMLRDLKELLRSMQHK